MRTSLLPLLILGAGLGAPCEASKSSNPLSPSVAGPIAGVNITAPQPVSPASNSEIAITDQPVTLTVRNASTNGVRPLSYIFEVASDAQFVQKVYSKASVPAGDGQTSNRLSDVLAAAGTYYWRARAEDGANTGSYTNSVAFTIYVPVVIQPPTPVQPINGATRQQSGRPSSSRTRPGAVQPAPSFTSSTLPRTPDSHSTSITWTFPEQQGSDVDDHREGLAARQGVVLAGSRRGLQEPGGLVPAFWRSARRSAEDRRRAPRRPRVLPGPAPASDMINLGAAVLHNSPTDLANWSITTALQTVDIQPQGVLVEFSKKDGRRSVARRQAAQDGPGRCRSHARDVPEHRWPVALLGHHRVLARSRLRWRTARRIRQELVLRSDPMGSDEWSSAGRRRDDRVLRVRW